MLRQLRVIAQIRSRRRQMRPRTLRARVSSPKTVPRRPRAASVFEEYTAGLVMLSDQRRAFCKLLSRAILWVVLSAAFQSVVK